MVNNFVFKKITQLHVTLQLTRDIIGLFEKGEYTFGAFIDLSEEKIFLIFF